MNKIVKNALILTAITLIAGLLLGAVHDITLEPIRKQQEKAKQEACQEVFPEAAEFVPVDLTGREDEIATYLSGEGYTAQTVDEIWSPLDADGNAVGLVVILSTSEGYGGGMQFSMGIAEDGTMTGISFLSLSETAGLGMRADTKEFRAQFQEKKVEAFSYTKTGASAEQEIDALSGATMTTSAVTNGVNAGLSFFRYWQEADPTVKGGSQS